MNDEATSVGLTTGTTNAPKHAALYACPTCGGPSVQHGEMCPRCYETRYAPKKITAQEVADILGPITTAPARECMVCHKPQEHWMVCADCAAKNPPKNPTPVKDKSLIWDDCAECAYKHLVACFAAVTAGSASVRAPAVDVLKARAWVALGEAESGYTGNADLAAGCLALAENLCDDWHDAQELRDARLRIGKAGVHSARLSLPKPAMAAFAGAHFTEALRELPALAERISFDAWTGDIGFNVTEPVEFLAMLRRNIAWLADVYELRGGK